MAKYTKEQEHFIIDTYLATPTTETVDYLAKQLNVPVRSIIAKLSGLGVYKRKVYTTKSGEPPIKKAELADALGAQLQLQDFEIEQLEKLSKALLIKLIDITRPVKKQISIEIKNPA